MCKFIGKFIASPEAEKELCLPPNLKKKNPVLAVKLEARKCS